MFRVHSYPGGSLYNDVDGTHRIGIGARIGQWDVLPRLAPRPVLAVRSKSFCIEIAPRHDLPYLDLGFETGGRALDLGLPAPGGRDFTAPIAIKRPSPEEV